MKIKTILLGLNILAAFTSYSQEAHDENPMTREALKERLKLDDNYRSSYLASIQRAKIIAELAALRETNPAKFKQVMKDISEKLEFKDYDIHFAQGVHVASSTAVGGLLGGLFSISISPTDVAVLNGLGAGFSSGFSFGLSSVLGRGLPNAQMDVLIESIESMGENKMSQIFKIISSYYATALHLESAREKQIHSKLESEFLLAKSKGTKVDLKKVFNPEEMSRIAALNQVARELATKIKEKDKT